MYCLYSPPLTVTSTGQYQTQCTYVKSGAPTSTDYPTTSPPSTSSACETLAIQAIACINSELEPSVATECSNCFLNQADSFVDVTSCDEAEAAVCSVLSCSCGSCTDDMEAAFNCVGDESGCQFDCGIVDPSGSGGVSMRSYSTVVLGLVPLLCT